MFLFLTTCVILASAFLESSIFEILPPTGECPERKILNEHHCKWSFLGPCGAGTECWGGILDSTTHGCGCIINNDGKRYYNEPSGKSCKAGEEASMICKTRADVDVCEDVDGWTVTCDAHCSNWSDLGEWFEETHGDLDTSYFTTAQCAALCVGDCIGFDMNWRGCGHFYTEGVFSEEYRGSSKSSCFQRTPPLEEDCADWNAGEGWIVECGHRCWDEGWETVLSASYIPEISFAQCAELCEVDDCGFFHFTVENGGSCQLVNATLHHSSDQFDSQHWQHGACVHRGAPESSSNVTREGSTEHLPDCTDAEMFEVFSCLDHETGEQDDEGTWVYELVSPPDGMEQCEFVDQIFSKDGCCESCSQCARDWYEAAHGIDGCDSDDEDFFSKIKNGDFSSLTTLELLGLGVVALVLFMLIVGLCCCCCKCSGRNETKQISMC